MSSGSLQMSTIDLPVIIEYVSGFKRPLLSKSKTHFFSFGRLKTSNSSLHFVAACLIHNLKAQPHRINVTETSNSDGEVQLKGTCTCKANTSDVDF